MRTFFWDYDDYNDIGREWSMFALNILALIFTGWALLNTAKYHRRCIFEIIPLSLNCFATLVLLFLKLFEKGYEFDEIAYVIEIFTYFLFCYTFSQIHIKVAQDANRLKLICNISLGLCFIFSLIMTVLVLVRVIAKDCDNNLLVPGLISFAGELICFIPTTYFGIQILKKIEQAHTAESESLADEYIKERKKQVKLVLGAFAASVILRGLILILTSALDDYIDCFECEGMYIITSDNALGQCLLVLIEINQLIPHVVIPIALYVVPVKRRRKSLVLEEGLIDEEEYDHHERIQQHIASSIISKNSSLKSIESEEDV